MSVDHFLSIWHLSCCPIVVLCQFVPYQVAICHVVLSLFVSWPFFVNLTSIVLSYCCPMPVCPLSSCHLSCSFKSICQLTIFCQFDIFRAVLLLSYASLSFIKCPFVKLSCLSVFHLFVLGNVLKLLRWREFELVFV